MTTLASNETQLIDRIEEVGAKIQKVRDTTASFILSLPRGHPALALWALLHAPGHR